MRWKYYFWARAALYILGFFALFFTPSVNFSLSLINMLFATLVIVGLYSYAFKKTIFKQIFWKIVFVLLLVSMSIEILGYIYSFINLIIPLKISFLPPIALGKSSVGEFILMSTLNLVIRILVLTAPPLYAIYKLGYSKR